MLGYPQPELFLTWVFVFKCFFPFNSPSPTHLQKHTWPLAGPSGCALPLRPLGNAGNDQVGVPFRLSRVGSMIRPMKDRALRCATRSWRHREKGGAPFCGIGDGMGDGQMNPLVNYRITIENHHCSWENSLFLWWFSIVMLNYQRVPFNDKAIYCTGGISSAILICHKALKLGSPEIKKWDLCVSPCYKLQDTPSPRIVDSLNRPCWWISHDITFASKPSGFYN